MLEEISNKLLELDQLVEGRVEIRIITHFKTVNSRLFLGWAEKSETIQ